MTNIKIPTHQRFVNIQHNRYGRLVVISYAGKSNTKRQRTQWLCQCDCGNKKIILGSDLSMGITKSCGCLHKDMISSHKMTDSGEYSSWKSIKQRCLNQNNPHKKNYIERGITMCDRWLKFENFLADMGAKPTPKHSIDRIDNNGNYTPENCRWATQKQQMRNTRETKIVKAFGGMHDITTLCERFNINGSTIRKRLKNWIKKGYTIEDCFTAPVDISKKTIGSTKKETQRGE